MAGPTGSRVGAGWARSRSAALIMSSWESSSFASWAKEVGRLISRVEVKRMRADNFRFMIDWGLAFSRRGVGGGGRGGERRTGVDVLCWK